MGEKFTVGRAVLPDSIVGPAVWGILPHTYRPEPPRDDGSIQRVERKVADLMPKPDDHLQPSANTDEFQAAFRDALQSARGYVQDDLVHEIRMAQARLNALIHAAVTQHRIVAQPETAPSPLNGLTYNPLRIVLKKVELL